MAPKPTAAATKTNSREDYALSKVDFSDPSVGAGTTTPTPPSPSSSDSSSDLKKPSLVFVRSTEIKPTLRPNSPEDTEETLALAAGTRLVARLQTPVSSAVAAPVVAVVEYNYERNGQIVLAAGAFNSAKWRCPTGRPRRSMPRP
jgi:type IV secretory pathway VirB10-like protein